MPWSQFAGEVLARDCAVPRERILAMQVGLDLELWPKQPSPINQRPQVLFVGGNFVRKGGDLLVDVWRRRFVGTADLHLVTKEPPAGVPEGVTVYTNLDANAPQLRELYAKADLFVCPTRADLSSFVALEAHATGRPVITTRTGGIPDIVVDGETGFLLEPGDAAGLEDRLGRLLADRDLRQEMGARGRAWIEERFDAGKNVPRILKAMKVAVDQARG